MNRSLGVRYLPLAAVIAVQLLIVAVAPSKAPTVVATAAPGAGGGEVPGFVDEGIPGFDGGTTDDPATSGFDGSTDGTGGSTDPFDGGTTGGSSGGSTGGSSTGGSTGGTTGGSTGGTTGGSTGGTTGGSSGGSSGGGSSGGTGGTGGGNQASGDKSHCVGDRQYDPAIDFYAPPCVATFTGTNNGESYRGVTGDTIKIVQYYGKGSDAVDAILRAQGAYVSIDQHREYNVAAQKFINDKYELWGRKVEIVVFEGNCSTIPPDLPCLRSEMTQMVNQLKPFAVVWNTSVCSACFEELSKLKVVNVGGWNFRDEFGARWRPYHYDVAMSGTRLAQHAGELWCKQMSGQKAIYAHRDADYRAKTRQLGVISTNDPQNQASVEIDLKAELAKCGQDYGPRKYFYEQDITTADQQRRAGVLAMRGPSAISKDDDATSVMCFCDLVAPSFLYQEQDVQSYYPENIIVGSGYMDSDAASQAYEGSVGCPQGDPCSFTGAFGFRSTGKADPEFTGRGHRVWTAGGGGELGSTPYESADVQWDNFNLVASAIQMAGPDLTPETFEAGAFRLGARGDAKHVMRQFSPGNYAWAQDVDRVYWSAKQSSYNGESGTYVSLDGFRTAVGSWKQAPLQLPAMPR